MNFACRLILLVRGRQQEQVFDSRKFLNDLIPDSVDDSFSVKIMEVFEIPRVTKMKNDIADRSTPELCQLFFPESYHLQKKGIMLLFLLV